MSKTLQDEIVDDQRFRFNRLIMVSDLDWVGNVGVFSHDLEGFLGLEVRQNLLNHSQQFLKRVLDLLAVAIGAVFVAPLFLLIALLIRLDTPGGIFFFQDRVGRYGKQFRMWKFRTMVENADEILQPFLESSPEFSVEWEATQKLKDDPRITRVGKWLRKLSLDELPQLINILKGEMSLVGPRPFFISQKEMYGKNYSLYKHVRPGLTGMWQVSGRNNTTFPERAHWDGYYVRNWSIWLDVYILVRTVWVVLSGEGAY